MDNVVDLISYLRRGNDMFLDVSAVLLVVVLLLLPIAGVEPLLLPPPPLS